MKNKFTYHVIGVPHTVSSKSYNACAYTQKVVKFCKMMTERGHTVYHYGHEESDVICTEHVTVLPTADWKLCYGDHDWRKHFFKYDQNDHAYQTFYRNSITEIGKRKKEFDFILPFWGSGVRPVCDAHPDLITVEPGIGYPQGHWADYKIFESYAVYHAYYGLNSVGNCQQNWYDVVIPNFFDPDDFEFKERKQDYFLYLGRVYDGKGVRIAIEVSQSLNARLIIAGQGTLSEMGYKEVPPHVTEYGYATVEERKRLMSNAIGTFVPSLYVEPFGGVQVESLFSGTPTITTDWGSFTENNVNGLTGYRCRTFEEFQFAAMNVMGGEIKPQDCRDFAMSRFSLDVVAEKYENYFESIMDLYQINPDSHHNKPVGWYTNHTSRWMKQMKVLNLNPTNTCVIEDF